MADDCCKIGSLSLYAFEIGSRKEVWTHPCRTLIFYAEVVIVSLYRFFCLFSFYIQNKIQFYLIIIIIITTIQI